MNDKCFFDTNIVVYLYSQDETNKQSIARSLFRDSQPVISTQVLSEFANVLHRKFKVGYTDIAIAIAQIIYVSQVVVINSSNIINALNIADKYYYSFYDSLVIATALAENCTILYTEDLQHGQEIESKLLIQNPFKIN